MNHIIITGHSKGLGAGIALEMIDENHHIHGIARTDNTDIQKLAAAKGCGFNFYPCDLGHTDQISAIMQLVFANITRTDNIEGIYLINNAGMIHPIGPVPTLENADIDLHLRVNLLAPMLIIKDFITHSSSIKATKRVINISSGAATSPYHGWSSYCTSKAGLDMFTRCCATEQEGEKYPIEFMAVAPGIIDTDMQTTIRGTTDEQFIHRKKFVELKETGQLVSPALAGKKLKELLFSSDFKNGEITDIRHLY
ncbi:MAG: (S)-benzoin forming benzil reductase [Bacteroidetes bacterium]|nr:MAG: (S)-benzoin forming benzil reductase [Bacteroidota bacterium]